MKICITSEGDSLESVVDPRFGRCRYFVIADTDSMQFEIIENPNIQSTGGAGIQSAQLIASKQAKAVITGNVGPNAFQTLQAAGIGIFVGVSGTIREAIERYKKGEFKPVSAPSVASHSGIPGKKK